MSKKFINPDTAVIEQIMNDLFKMLEEEASDGNSKFSPRRFEIAVGKYFKETWGLDNEAANKHPRSYNGNRTPRTPQSNLEQEFVDWLIKGGMKSDSAHTYLTAVRRWNEFLETLQK